MSEEYWWAVFKKDDKLHIMGPYREETMAHMECERMSPSAMKVISLPTRDENKATRMVKARLKRTENVSH